PTNRQPGSRRDTAFLYQCSRFFFLPLPLGEGWGEGLTAQYRYHQPSCFLLLPLSPWERGQGEGGALRLEGPNTNRAQRRFHRSIHRMELVIPRHLLDDRAA